MFGLFKKRGGKAASGRKVTFRLIQVGYEGEIVSDERFEVGPGQATFGRLPDNEIVIPSGFVGKRHARIDFRGDEVIVTDLGTTNGTVVNGKKISEPTSLSPGDVISFDDYRLSRE
jgi:pSer/pThr/pTyr-binding forkhead associated (FHA) protein